MQILSDKAIVNARMDFGFAKVDNQKVCVLDIYVAKRNFEKHLNLGISNEHVLVLYEQVLNDLLDNFLSCETIGLSRYYSVKSMQANFTGINAVNALGSKIKINFNLSGTEFMSLIDMYNRRIDEYETELNNSDEIKR